MTDERVIVNASQIYVSYVKMGDSGKYQLIVNNTVDRRISLLFEIRVEGMYSLCACSVCVCVVCDV